MKKKKKKYILFTFIYCRLHLLQNVNQFYITFVSYQNKLSSVAYSGIKNVQIIWDNLFFFLFIPGFSISIQTECNKNAKYLVNIILSTALVLLTWVWFFNGTKLIHFHPHLKLDTSVPITCKGFTRQRSRLSARMSSTHLTKINLKHSSQILKHPKIHFFLLTLWSLVVVSSIINWKMIKH